MPGNFPDFGKAKAPATYAVTTTTGEAVAQENRRIGIHITNVGAGWVYLGFSTNSAELNKGIALAPYGGSYEMVAPYCTQEEINAIGDVASTLAIQEWIG